MVSRWYRRARLRLVVVWHVLRGKPTMFRMHTGPMVLGTMRDALLVDCHIDGNLERPKGALITFSGQPSTEEVRE